MNSSFHFYSIQANRYFLTAVFPLAVLLLLLQDSNLLHWLAAGACAALTALGATVAHWLRIRRSGAHGHNASPDAPARPQAPRNDVALSRTRIRACTMSAAGEMVPALIHDLYQPLSVIRGYLDLLRFTEKEPDKTYTAALDACVECTDRISATMDDLRDFTTTLESDLRTISILDVFNEALAFLSTQFSQHNISIELKRDLDLPDLLLHAHDFKLAFLCLLMNARDSLDEKAAKSSPDASFRKHITAEFFQQSAPPRVVCRISDNGNGLSENANAIGVPVLFGSTKPRGTGLGLLAVQDVVRFANGTVDIRSIPDGGFAVTLEIPIPTHPDELD